MYAERNPRTKKILKEWIASGKTIHAFQPGGMFAPNFSTGKVYLEGPHYPACHTWYAQATVDQDGKILTVK